MILERMLEFWLLVDFLRRIPSEMLGDDEIKTDTGDSLNLKKMFERFTELQSEFLAPYVIDNPPKGV